MAQSKTLLTLSACLLSKAFESISVPQERVLQIFLQLPWEQTGMSGDQIGNKLNKIRWLKANRFCSPLPFQRKINNQHVLINPSPFSEEKKKAG